LFFPKTHRFPIGALFYPIILKRKIITGLTVHGLIRSPYMVDAVGVVLRLETEGRELPVLLPGLSRAVLHVLGRVKLQTRLCGARFHVPPTGWVVDSTTAT